MRPFRRVCIIGTGLIGGSLALALKKKHLAGTVIGISRSRRTAKIAEQRRIVERASCDLKDASGADLVVLAAPVDVILQIAKPLARIIGKDCLVSDVGSTKKAIVTVYEKLFSSYIGSHPLAGSEKKGIEYADERLFADSICITCPTSKTAPAAQIRIEDMWRALGACVHQLSPKEHDRVLSCVSHLPHAVAFCLVRATPDAYMRFASGGWSDTTRIAASDSRLWSSIFMSNAGNILAAIKDFEQELTVLKNALRKSNKRSLQAWLRAAQRKRQFSRDHCH